VVQHLASSTSISILLLGDFAEPMMDEDDFAEPMDEDDYDTISLGSDTD